MSQIFSMIVLVAAGGALGGALRLGMATLLQSGLQGRHFPWPTTLVNLTGCLFLGGVIAWMGLERQLDSVVWLAAAVGFAGALTTVSSFSMEVIALIRDRRFEMAGLYILTSLFGCLLMFLVGRLCVLWLIGSMP